MDRDVFLGKKSLFLFKKKIYIDFSPEKCYNT